MTLRFTKMHGAGNDFVVIDRRAEAVPLDVDTVARIGDRHRGVGFDQLLTLETTARADCAAGYRIFNADGSAARQCGNGVRCLAAFLRRAEPKLPARFRLDGPAGVVSCEFVGDDAVRVDMGAPRFAPEDLPFIAEPGASEHTIDLGDTSIALDIASMGNPHCLIEVLDIDQAPVATWGPRIERHARFPDRVNVGFAQVIDRGHVKLRVFERGVGETLACGSGACAAAVMLMHRDRVDARVAMQLPGGTLTIEWQGDGHPVWMTGPYRFVFEGTWTS